MSADQNVGAIRETRESIRRSIIDRRLSIREMLRTKMRPDEIAKACHVDLATIYRDLKAIGVETERWYWQMARGGLKDAHRLSIEVLEERQRKLMDIEANGQLEAKDRIAASVAIAEIESLIHSWLPLTKILMEDVELKKTSRREGSQHV